MKRILAFVLLATLIFSFNSTAFAAESVSTKLRNVDISGEGPLNPDDVNLYCRYLLHFPDGEEDFTSSAITSNEILASCRVLSKEETGGFLCATYCLKEPLQLLPEKCKVTSICSVGEIIFVQYTTGDKVDVTASYDATGFHDLFVYYPDSDTAIYISRDSQIIYDHFLYGSYEEAYEDDVLVRDSTPNLRATESIKSNFSDTSAMIQDLKQSFPIINSNENFALLCPALGAYRAVRVNSSRANYMVVSANYRVFTISTAVSTIAYFLSLPAALAVTILTGIGIGITAAALIEEQVKLYSTGNFSYTGTKTGLVYDTTVYSQYVYVKRYSDNGSFAGGYDSQGVFRWVENNQSSAWYMENSGVAASAMNDYNWDVSLNGYCTNYSPTGFW